MKPSKRNIQNADYEAHKRISGKPIVSKYARKNGRGPVEPDSITRADVRFATEYDYRAVIPGFQHFKGILYGDDK